ncbi:hypothetical protein HAZT_HAZT008504 [Hyalella azteca]|uniref:Solute carrier organic anion transporter family member n=1 Tax=Hyalella azteca TaxID=294128 RepID=A0A6A0GV26_HYAAZ|nr:hypothetical protein HAZT_HAZT008504 [Hyalella azteca]
MDENCVAPQKPAAGAADDEQPAPGDGCGWHFCFSGRCVQHSRTAKWLLFWMCWAAAVQGMVVNGFVNVNITTIEKRFNLMSGSTGIISGSYDVASVLVSVPVSYLGSRPGSSKPRWLGAGLIILGLGSYMFMLPHLLVPPYEVRVDNDTLGTQTSSLCHEQLRTSDTCNSTSEEEGLPNFIWFFITGQYLMGFGAAPIYTLGMAFIDESVSPTQSAFYLGIFSTMAMVGPALGYAIGGQLLSVYIDAPVVNAAELGLTPASNRWLGAWWISFLITGSLSLLVAIPILMIPAEVDKTAAFKRSDRKSLPSNEDEGSSRDFDTSSVDAIPASGVTAFRQLDGLWTASKSLLSCLPFIFLSIAKSCEGFVLSGMATFLPKVLETQFSLPAGLAATVVGALAISGGGSGILAGGLLIKRLKMTCENVIRLCFVVSSFCMFSAFIFFIRCPNAKFAGLNIAYNRQGARYKY